MKSIPSFFILFFIFSIPMFSQNPIIENTSICITNESTASIIVTNPSLTSTYTWQVKTSTADWTDITVSNAGLIYDDYTTSSLTIIRKNSLPLSLTKYRVIANKGTENLISNEAILTVAQLSVAKTIIGASPVCIGGDKELFYASGSVGDIQWQSSITSSSSDFEDINLANGISYKAIDLQDNTWFRVISKSGACNPAYSDPVLVVVNTLPIAGNIEGGDIDVCKSLNVTDLYLYNSQGSISWQKSSSLEGTYTDISSANFPLYRASLLSTNTYFRVAVSNGVCPIDYSEPVYINVDPESETKSITGISKVCAGSSIALSYGAGSVGDIQWQTSTTSAFSDFIDETDQIGLTFRTEALQETTWFRVVNTSGVCNPAYSSALQVVVNPLAEEGSIENENTSVCKTTNSTRINLNDSVGDIQWQSAADVAGEPGTFSNLAVGATKNFYIASALTNTTYFRAIVSSGVCPTATSKALKITVDQPAIVKNVLGATPVCFGGSKVLIYEPDSFGAIQWQSSTTSATDGFIDEPGEDLETFTKYNLKKTTWFRASNTNGVCNTLYSPAVRVLVNPLPVSGSVTKAEESKTIASNTNSPELTLLNYIGDIQWQQSKNSTDSFIDIPNATTSSYKANDLKEATYFRAIVSSGNCSKVASEPFKVDVNTDFDVTLFPNPFDQESSIYLNSYSQDLIEFQTYDLLGRRIETKTVKPSEINALKIGTHYLPGFYTVLVKQGNLNQTLKVLKK